MTYQQCFETASPGSVVFCPAAQFPGERRLTPEAVACCRQKKLRVLLEMPQLPEAVPYQLSPEMRGVVTRHCASLPVGSLLQCSALQLSLPRGQVSTWLEAAQVAGYRQLVFPQDQPGIPLLYVHPNCPTLLIATIPLSEFKIRRWMPQKHWELLWQEIGRFLGQLLPVPDLPGAPRPTYDATTPLSPQAWEKGQQKIYQYLTEVLCYRDAAGVIKVAEGFASEIQPDGRQKKRLRERSDCVFEVVGALAVAARLEGHKPYRELAENITQRLLQDPAHCALEPDDPCTGQFTFYDDIPVYYSTGNSRTFLYLALGWPFAPNPEARAQAIVRLGLSLYRTTGTLGQRESSFRVPNDFPDGNWTKYRDRNFTNDCPHRQAALWSMLLALGKMTGETEFTLCAKRGIDHLMQKYPRIPWTNDYSAELAKLLTPLAFLYRAQPTPQHRAYLDQVVRDLQTLTTPQGAVRASLGERPLGTYPPPLRNAEFGRHEAPIIQQDGDPCCDLLYTQAFALSGMNEVYHATGDAAHRQLRDQLAEFLLRSQITAPGFPEFDGAWMRAFDFELWDYYGSSADRYWGPYCIESGWINAPAARSLTLIRHNQSIYDLLPTDPIFKDTYRQLWPQLRTLRPMKLTPRGVERPVLGDEN